MHTKIDLLEQLPLFDGFSASELQAVAAVADEVDVPGGYALTVEGATGREFVVLVDGAARVDQGGRTIATLGPGDFLGEIGLLTRSARTATVTTTAPSHVLVVGEREFRRLHDEVPFFSARVWAAAAARLVA